MKVLLLLQYPGYMRYFDVVVRALLDRGHSVHVAFDRPQKQAEGLEALPVDNPQLVVADRRFPRRSDEWRDYALEVRGLIDYVRYLDWRYRKSRYLRGRAAGALPEKYAFLKSVPYLPSFVVRRLRRRIAALEEKVPSANIVERYIRKVQADVVLVSPLVNVRSWQTDAVKSAKALGIPTGLCVGSWDHLTTKGLVRIQPDRVFVWNPTQKREAIELHDIPAEKIVVTGAQPFDKWFGREPSLSREEFCASVGLADARPYILFVGSTASISKPEAEVEFVRRWLGRLREDGGPLREIGVLVRPHPFNSEHWADVDLGPDPYVSVFPRGGANPVNEVDRAVYFHSLHYSASVVGINTSAMVEAAILGKPVLTVTDSAFDDTQQGTLHFRYLLAENGGFLETARNLDDHSRQLARVIEDSAPVKQRLAAFVDHFVRPCGRGQSGTEILVHAIEELGRLPCPKAKKVKSKKAQRQEQRQPAE